MNSNFSTMALIWLGEKPFFEKVKNWVMALIGATGVKVGTLDQTTAHFPTTRKDGSPLHEDDYCDVSSTAIVPFTVDGITINKKTDTVYWSGSIWVLKAGVIINTDEVIVKNKASESIKGTCNYQNQINEEIKTNLTYVHNQNVANNLWEIIHNLGRYPSVRTLDNYGNEILGAVTFPSGNEIRISFADAQSGKAYLS